MKIQNRKTAVKLRGWAKPMTISGYARSLPDDGRPTLKGLEVVLDALAKEDPKAKGLSVQQLLDLRFLP
jgi:hypothetical protein